MEREQHFHRAGVEKREQGGGSLSAAHVEAYDERVC